MTTLKTSNSKFGVTLVKEGEFIVTKGSTSLYKKVIVEGIPTYKPFSVEDNNMLITIRDALMGDVRAQESSAYKQACVRFGWIEESFNSLKFIEISQLHNDYMHNKLTKADKRKFSEVLRILFISVKDVPRYMSASELSRANKRHKTYDPI